MRHRNALQKPLNFFRNPALAGIIVLGITLLCLGSLPRSVFADAASDLQQQIADQNAKIAALEQEIVQYENTLDQIGSTKQTLQGEITRLTLSQKKMAADIAVTQGKINAANLELQRLSGAIVDKTTQINDSTKAIEKSLRTLYEIGDATLIEQILSGNGIVEAWSEVDRTAQLQTALKEEIATLQGAKQSLTDNYNATNKQKAALVSLKNQLAGQKLVLDQSLREQAALLAQTKDKESTYQKILADKRAAKAQFEKQLSDYEASLKYTLDPRSIPRAGTGVLSFPLDPAFMQRCSSRVSVFGNSYCITQYFGNTAFAQSGAYNGQGHNGVDFGAPEGTMVVAALSGTVLGTGNTDLSHDSAGHQCYSYGKWVYIQHPNGLGSIYGHLSVISVVKGQSVTTGQILGYSGKTGYATGPHLHFGVYVASQVKIIQLGDRQTGKKTPCANAFMPVAPTQAYLNPMQYL